MYRLIRPLLFRLDAEQAHNLTLMALRLTGRVGVARQILLRLFDVADARLEVEAFGLRFRNPVGLAAGYDKNGVAVAGLGVLGLGHLEIGTLTRLPQTGNPRPRIHRLPGARAIVNRMGFPNAGIEALPPDLATTARSGSSARPPVRIGINLGKGRDMPLERAAEDYCALLQHVHSHRQADYVTINISSPNTAGLRRLQAPDSLEGLLGAVAEARNALQPRLPLLVKIAPDLSEAEVDAVAGVAADAGMDGIIATNTTISREGVPEAAGLEGGLSGAPLRARSTQIIGRVAQATDGRLPIIGVGGIMNAADALEKLRAGAHLLQIYTGLVYTGPGLVSQINRGLLQACAAEGVAEVGALRRA